jgi:hypothetical protein
MHISGHPTTGWRVMSIACITLGSATRGSVVVGTFLALILAGCSGQIQIEDLGESAGGDPEVAASTIDRWFELARSGQNDFGWSLLHPRGRSDLIGSIEAYREAMAAIDWSGFEYEVVGGRLHDGRYKIDVMVAGGRASVPLPICRWGLIQFAPVDGELTDVGTVTVRIPPLGGESGILGSGGC